MCPRVFLHIDWKERQQVSFIETWATMFIYIYIYIYIYVTIFVWKSVSNMFIYYTHTRIQITQKSDDTDDFVETAATKHVWTHTHIYLYIYLTINTQTHISNVHIYTYTEKSDDKSSFVETRGTHRPRPTQGDVLGLEKWGDPVWQSVPAKTYSDPHLIEI